ncbi:hypothetical protein DSO57_1015457 [Entomophthora muscae]|uniref:Uncharacterized protein n=1 Tax=Entomophthora muscae TaxID=34485 RepID=A0ACC2SUI6_9FUNG|nr:hypothetical protein DSO57_1015457 [Entomophthora muscae]
MSDTTRSEQQEQNEYQESAQDTQAQEENQSSAQDEQASEGNHQSEHQMTEAVEEEATNAASKEDEQVATESAETTAESDGDGQSNEENHKEEAQLNENSQEIHDSGDKREKRDPPRRYRYFVENQLKKKSSTYISKALDAAESGVDQLTTTLGDINPFLSLERLRDDRSELRPFIYMFNFMIYMLAALNTKHIYHAIMCLLFMYPTAGGFLTVMSLLSEDAERAANIGRRAAFLILSVGIDYTFKLFSFTRRNVSRGFRPVGNKPATQQ